MRGILAAALALTLAGVVMADDKTAEAQKAVEAKIAELKGGKPAKIEALNNEAATRTCPGHHFFGVYYAQFPVARALPEGLSPSMVFAVSDGKATVIREAKELEAYFVKHCAKAGDDAKKKDAARAWLKVAQALHQDLFYTFTLMDDSTKVDGNKAGGKLVVMQGGNGEINVTLTFDDQGKLTKVAEEARIQPGPRPRCHATRLNDPDPLIRGIMEEDLLIMGKPALPYLAEQRDQARPELRQAIEAVMRRIERGER